MNNERFSSAVSDSKLSHRFPLARSSSFFLSWMHQPTCFPEATKGLRDSSATTLKKRRRKSKERERGSTEIIKRRTKRKKEGKEGRRNKKAIRVNIIPNARDKEESRHERRKESAGSETRKASSPKVKTEIVHDFDQS